MEVNAARLSTTVKDEHETGEAGRGLEGRVEVAARDLARAINDTQGDERNALRDLAIDILRDDRASVEPDVPQPSPTAGGDKFNPFGIGIPLALMGMVLVFLFPLVGLVMFAAAFIMLAWGVGSILLTRS